ncbi:MAG: thioredoxin family protein [Negativicutes bacterium]|nr:thioredoxin family protein [Negativicutes bacterium]
MKIEILGSCCQKCTTLLEVTQEAVAEAGVDADIVKVQDFKEIMKYGVMTTPALVIDGVVKVVGKVPSKEQIKSMLK